MAGQKPMAQRKKEMMELIWKYKSYQAHRLEKAVLKRLIKEGKVKIVTEGYGYGHGGKTNAMAVATIPAPVVEEAPYTGGPYAKRRGWAEIAGHSYRGKTHGKIRRDKPREEREAKEAEKKKMWALLKHHKY